MKEPMTANKQRTDEREYLTNSIIEELEKLDINALRYLYVFIPEKFKAG